MVELIGQILAGRYRVDAFLGRGGMAEVYKVWDSQKAVFLAIKVLREDFAQDKIFLRRFRDEAQKLEKLQHPHIVRFYDLESGHEIFTMAGLDGDFNGADVSINEDLIYLSFWPDSTQVWGIP